MACPLTPLSSLTSYGLPSLILLQLHGLLLCSLNTSTLFLSQAFALTIPAAGDTIPPQGSTWLSSPHRADVNSTVTYQGSCL